MFCCLYSCQGEYSEQMTFDLKEVRDQAIWKWELGSIPRTKSSDYRVECSKGHMAGHEVKEIMG